MTKIDVNKKKKEEKFMTYFLFSLVLIILIYAYFYHHIEPSNTNFFSELYDELSDFDFFDIDD